MVIPVFGNYFKAFFFRLSSTASFFGHNYSEFVLGLYFSNCQLVMEIVHHWEVQY
jgi:hypothetical protein